MGKKAAGKGLIKTLGLLLKKKGAPCYHNEPPPGGKVEVKKRGEVNSIWCRYGGHYERRKPQSPGLLSLPSCRPRGEGMKAKVLREILTKGERMASRVKRQSSGNKKSQEKWPERGVLGEETEILRRVNGVGDYCEEPRIRPWRVGAVSLLGLEPFRNRDPKRESDRRSKL